MFASYLINVSKEIKNISWEKRSNVLRVFYLVVFIIFIFSVLFYGVDFFAFSLIKWILI